MGIRRVRRGRGFVYVDAKGHAITAPVVLARIRRLAIPPAWENVWICPSPRGHIQATGRDARGRKQYRYHEDFRRERDETKYHRVLAFAEVLPKIRAQVDADMRRRDNDREKVLATVVRLLEISLIRVGHEEYTRENGSYGLTTMTMRHVDVRGSTIRFHFRGKSGQMRDVDVHDKTLSRVLQQIGELPGQRLFQYVDERGKLKSIEANDVNDYLRRVSGEDVTAKDFRTWAGTVLAAHALRDLGDVKAAIASAAARLGNTPAVCRSCYVHPEVLAAHEDGSLALHLERGARMRSELLPHEAAVVALLRRRASSQGRAA
jgi:DNA topoisomerase I